ncbi:peptidase M20 domain-containing protein 2 isoform X2 [Aplysia californica]|nr:peptidase M20 domain-containing protein 2 isoform X2 [Aplysia californica]
MTDSKKLACEAIERENSALRALSLDIWDHPELCFNEKHAHAAVTDFLEQRGFQVERHFKLDTAFRATASSKDTDADTPTIGVMCEYDALPGIGHACGHNLIAIMGVSIALGIKEALEQGGVKGKLVVLGCPAEEGGGGKIDLINAGAYDDMDCAIMGHPSQFNLSRPVYVGMCPMSITYKGKASHASSFPWDGVNALDAAVLCYQNVSCMRQHMRPTWRVHGVITHGGEKPNIIPQRSELLYYTRAPTVEELEELKSKVKDCVEGAAKATGCSVEYKFGANAYAPLLSNDILATLYEKNGQNLGIEFENDPTRLSKQGGSTDMGNVSQILPSIHPKYSINTMVAAHTTDFRDKARTEESHDLTLIHSKAMALAAIDVCNDPPLVAQMQAELKQRQHPSARR